MTNTINDVTAPAGRQEPVSPASWTSRGWPSSWSARPGRKASIWSAESGCTGEIGALRRGLWRLGVAGDRSPKITDQVLKRR